MPPGEANWGLQTAVGIMTIAEATQWGMWLGVGIILVIPTRWVKRPPMPWDCMI